MDIRRRVFFLFSCVLELNLKAKLIESHGRDLPFLTTVAFFPLIRFQQEKIISENCVQ